MDCRYQPRIPFLLNLFDSEAEQAMIAELTEGPSLINRIEHITLVPKLGLR
jgi:hypothetical protein